MGKKRDVCLTTVNEETPGDRYLGVLSRLPCPEPEWSKDPSKLPKKPPKARPPSDL